MKDIGWEEQQEADGEGQRGWGRIECKHEEGGRGRIRIMFHVASGEMGADSVALVTLAAEVWRTFFASSAAVSVASRTNKKSTNDAMSSLLYLREAEKNIELCASSQ